MAYIDKTKIVLFDASQLTSSVERADLCYRVALDLVSYVVFLENYCDDKCFEIKELKDEVESLESWCKEKNDRIKSLQDMLRQNELHYRQKTKP